MHRRQLEPGLEEPMQMEMRVIDASQANNIQQQAKMKSKGTSTKGPKSKLPAALYYFDFNNKVRLKKGIKKPRAFQAYSNKDFSQYLQYLLKDDFYDKHFKERLDSMMPGASDPVENERAVKFRDVGCMGRVVSEKQLTTLERTDAENRDLDVVSALELRRPTSVSRNHNR